MEPVRPDFGGRALTGVMPGLLSDDRPRWMPEALKGARAVVLFVIDGLGWNILESHRSLLPALGAMGGSPVTTVAPSTTSSALTSLTTGLAPAQHGITGFRMRVPEGVLNVLRWRLDGGRQAPKAFSVQRHTAFLGRAVPVVTRSEFRTSGFTEAHLRGGRFEGWSTPAVLVERCRRLVADGERLVYAYYPGVDTVGHEYGLHSSYFTSELRFADDLVARLVEVLPPDVCVVVTADHGQVHIPPGGWTSLGALDRFVDVYSGEGRFRHLYARHGAAVDLLDAARDETGHQAWVLTRDQLLDEGWLGPPGVAPARSVRRRVGDVVLAAREPVGFTDPGFPVEAALVGAHGSLTPDEMLVPLVAARGTARV